MATEPFEPAKHLSRVNGSEYLEVKWRLVWLRDRHPQASIHTEMIEHHLKPDEGRAVFKATITIPGTGNEPMTEVTGWGSESSGDFRDYLEKAETKAIGRACAAAGFGTQFSQDFDFGASHGRVVDAPVKVSNFSRGTPPQNPTGGSPDRAVAKPNPPQGTEHPSHTPVAAPAPEQAATQRQLRYVQAVAREAGLDAQALDELAQREFGAPAMALSRRNCSALINLIQAQQAEVPLAH